MAKSSLETTEPFGNQRRNATVLLRIVHVVPADQDLETVLSMLRQKLRIRFSKQGDLRLVSHRDLARAVERLFRRAELPLAMTEGFHPHPKISFVSALALGIEGKNEVMEVILSHPQDPDSVFHTLQDMAPEGLIIRSVEQIAENQPKTKLESVAYEITVPSERQATVKERMEAFLHSDSCVVENSKRNEPIDIRHDVVDLALVDSLLKMRLRFSRTASAGPRDVLKVLGLDSLEQEGYWLARTDVRLAGSVLSNAKEYV